MSTEKVINEATTIDNPVTLKEGAATEKRGALYLELDDNSFIETANKLISESTSFFNKKLNLEERRSKNEAYLFGRQINNTKLKDYNARFVDNIIWESESYIKPMALSRLPEIIVKPGSDTDSSFSAADSLSRVVNSDIKSRERRTVLAMAFKHLPVYFIGAIKPFWNPEKGKHGDYDFRWVHPNNLVLDYSASSANPDNMEFIAENIEYSVKEWVMRFPKKEADFYKELRKTGIFNDTVNEQTQKGMNTKVKGWEIWFTHYNKLDDGSFEKLECVAWFYNKLVLDKMKSPNWDWEGEKQTFRYDERVETEELQQSLYQAFVTGEPEALSGLETRKVFYNYLEYPRKPYILIGYDQWGKSPIDETSRIEQVILLQDNVDKRGKQITEMLDRARGKHVFSSEGGLKKEDIEDLDLNDPDQDLIVPGKVNEAHAFFPGEQPSVQMIQNLGDTRERIFAKMGVHGPARGAIDAGATATSNQIAREGDFSRSDDLVEDTINFAAEQMAAWILQFIRLRYTEDHFTKVLGEDGKTVFEKISRDLVDDGMEVTIFASGTDKLKAEQRAMDMAKLKMIDPFTFYKDLGVSDPKGRTMKLVAFSADVNKYLREFVNEGNPTLLDEPVAGKSQQALQDIMLIQQGQVPSVPAEVDQAYLETFSNFMNSPELEQLISQKPELKEPVLQFAEAVSAAAESGKSQNQVTTEPVGPVGSKPSPANTSRIAITPPGV